MDNDNYDIDYFMQDEAFVKWVKQSNKESNLYWREWVQWHPESRQNFMKAKELILAMDFESSNPSESESNEILQQVLQQKQSATQSNIKKTSHQLWKNGMRMAASILLFFAAAAAYIFSDIAEEPNEVTMTKSIIAKSNPYGRKSKLAFSDGSTATLNAGTTLWYHGKFDADRREVEVEGEAFFEVSKDINRPFIVKFGEVSVTVLGTSFNVEAHADDVISEISLKTGQLKIAIPSHSESQQTFVLEPGQRLIYNKENKNIDLLTMDPNDMDIWTEGILNFDNDNFKTVTRKLERWFDVEIQVDGLYEDDIKFSTRYKKENLNNILISMGFALNFDYEISDKLIRINFNE